MFFHHPWLEIEQCGEVSLVTIQVSSIVGDQQVHSLGQQLDGLVDAGYKNIILNMYKVGIMSSGALARFVGLNKRLLKLEGRVALCNINAPIMEAFKLTGLDRILPIYPDAHAALQSFGELAGGE